MKKVLSKIVDVILGLFVAFTVFCIGSMMITMRSNYGIPSLFGHSFLYVATDSMASNIDSDHKVEILQGNDYSIKVYDGWTGDMIVKGDKGSEKRLSVHEGQDSLVFCPEENDFYSFGFVDPSSAHLALGDDDSLTVIPGSPLEVGDGVVIKKVALDEIHPGDIITFYYPEIHAPDTHRVHEVVVDESGHYTFYTRGDNLKAGLANGVWRENYREVVDQDQFIGKLVASSKAFGTVLTFISPAVSAEKSHTKWVFPLIVITPLAIIAISSIISTIKEAKRLQREEDAEVKAALEASGIDPNDEAAVLRFEEKLRYKLEMKREMAKEKEKAKEEISKNIKKEKKRLRKELEDEKMREELKEELRQQLLAEKAAKEQESIETNKEKEEENELQEKN